jgi:hypothetical protein
MALLYLLFGFLGGWFIGSLQLGSYFTDNDSWQFGIEVVFLLIWCFIVNISLDYLIALGS